MQTRQTSVGTRRAQVSSAEAWRTVFCSARPSTFSSDLVSQTNSSVFPDRHGQTHSSVIVLAHQGSKTTQGVKSKNADLEPKDRNFLPCAEISTCPKRTDNRLSTTLVKFSDFQLNWKRLFSAASSLAVVICQVSMESLRSHQFRLNLRHLAKTDEKPQLALPPCTAAAATMFVVLNFVLFLRTA